MSEMPQQPPLSPGKTVLLKALDHLNEIEEETGGTVEYLAVVYGVVHRDEDGERLTTRGWDATEHPSFVHAGLLREIARRIEGDATEVDGET